MLFRLVFHVYSFISCKHYAVYVSVWFNMNFQLKMYLATFPVYPIFVIYLLFSINFDEFVNMFD